jgi:hypothetical protein
MITFQFLLHQQVFCSGTASAFFAIVKDKLPQVAQNAPVGSIVSKWGLTYQDFNEHRQEKVKVFYYTPSRPTN